MPGTSPKAAGLVNRDNMANLNSMILVFLVAVFQFTEAFQRWSVKCSISAEHFLRCYGEGIPEM